MNDLNDSLQYILPSILVFASSYFVTRGFLKRDEKKQKYEVVLNNQKEISKIRLQAYERLCLYTERINPELLIIRINTSGITNNQLQQLLLKNIRMEWEHNLSQQIYVSDKTWQLTKDAKENIVKLINTVSSSLNPHNVSMELCTKLLEIYNEESPVYIEKAINNMRTEIQSLMH